MALIRRSRIRRSSKPIPRRTPPWAKRVAAKLAGGIDSDSWQHVVEHFGGRCAFCQTAPWEQQDHVKPLARGGTHVIANVVPVCIECNQKKGTQTWAVPRPHRFMGAA